MHLEVIKMQFSIKMIYENESYPLYISEEGYKTTGDFAVYTLHD